MTELSLSLIQSLSLNFFSMHRTPSKKTFAVVFKRLRDSVIYSDILISIALSEATDGNQLETIRMSSELQSGSV